MDLTAVEVERLATVNERLDWLTQEPLTEELANKQIEHVAYRHAAVNATRMALLVARRALCEAQDAIAEIMVMRETPPRKTYRWTVVLMTHVPSESCRHP